MSHSRFETEAIEAFWTLFLEQVAEPEGVDHLFYESYRIGNSDAASDGGAALIMSGAKTATSSLLWEFEDRGMRPPAVGDLSILLDGRNMPVCVVETTWIEIKPFSQADEALARDYGEWDRTLETWRRQCWAHYETLCQSLNRVATVEMPIVFERFAVIFTNPARDDAPKR